MPESGVVDRLTVPEKPATEVAVIVLMAAKPTLAVTGLGLAVRVKVPVGPMLKLNVTTTFFEITGVALVAVTVTVNDADDTPAASVHCRVAVCGVAPNVTLAGRVHVAVVDGTDTTCPRFTVPVKPLRAFSVIIEDPVVAVELTGLGDALMLKSTTWNVMTAVAWLIVTPPTTDEPVTVTV
jgi:hypothetical protein